MCNFASFVLTKDRVFWSEKTDSHEDIIEEFGLSADGAKAPNILRVEVTPPKDAALVDWSDLSAWTYRVDQDIVPVWADAQVDEERVRAALVAKSLKVGGFLSLIGCTGLKALPENLKVGRGLDLPKHLQVAAMSGHGRQLTS